MAKDPVLTLEKMQMDDHNLLLRLEAKVDSLIVDVKELKDGTNLKLSEHELRIRKIEIVHEETNPKEAIRKVDEVYQWKHDFQLTFKIFLGIAGTIGGIIGFILSLVADTFRIFK